jgi:SAM-dependent methyltransferase
VAKKGRTISDFGNQWLIHGELDQDYWTSDALFRDHFENQTPPFEDLRGKQVVDVGSGSGRILQMLSRYNPKKLIGIEPSHGFEILKANSKGIKNLELVNCLGEDFSLSEEADYIFSLGVIHHIVEPLPVVKNIYNNLKTTGTFIMWVYGFENNQAYVLFQRKFRPLIRLIPDPLLNTFSLLCTYLLDLYAFVSRFLFKSRLPLTSYLNNLFLKCGRKQKKYIVFDQLNPVHAKYYKRHEVVSLLKNAGFEKIETFHRHGYSWTAIATK